ncbi:glycoside hydrolase family 6 protein [Streptomyces durmitorensis]|uniref:Glucanase n=1 Tax=Streptomyces durmitorensis TaxID=319947 RepID=A0ABY4Q6G9_9ACTN|nr:glycoside hydrolase family 6 protein [Streptomyces durmitorensis]UQT61830.1 glycoside hydrolase family 6 protein [Streptomyces durmitorensis]
MVAAASVVAAMGTVAGMVSALDEGGGKDRARPKVTKSPTLEPLPAVPTPSASASSAEPSPVKSSASPVPKPKPKPATPRPKKPTADPSANSLYRHGDSQVIDWVRAHRGDPRRPLIESRIADRPAAVWFAEYAPGTITSRVRAVTSSAGSRVPVVVPYAIPDRDCGGASQGGAPDLAAYDAWIGKFAAGLGSGEVVVILEPDAIALSECLSAKQRTARYASLARAGRTLKAANPRARVYFDAGHSGWNAAAKQAGRLRAAGAASPASSDGIFTNVSNFHRTGDEAAYARKVLSALGGPPGLGAVIDTSRNGNGAPADGEWCDPAGRGLGPSPTLRTGEARIDAYLWIKLPGESDGCKGAPGTFTPGYAYDLARG